MKFLLVKKNDAETDNWNEGASSPTAIVEGAAGATTGTRAPQRVYVLGLAVEQNPTPSTNQVYDSETDSWVTSTRMSTNRTYFGVAVINDTLYAIGGHLYPSGEVTGANEQYYPLAMEFHQKSKLSRQKTKRTTAQALP